jgi:hypothetical protein
VGQEPGIFAALQRPRRRRRPWGPWADRRRGTGWKRRWPLYATSGAAILVALGGYLLTGPAELLLKGAPGGPPVAAAPATSPSSPSSSFRSASHRSTPAVRLEPAAAVPTVTLDSPARPSARPVPSAIGAPPARARAARSRPPARVRVAVSSTPGVLLTPAAPGAITGSGALVSDSGRCLALEDGPATKGPQVRAADCDGTRSQRWTASPDGTLRSGTRCLRPVDPASSSPSGSASGSTSVPGSSRLVVDACTGAPTQVWALTARAVVQPSSGRCLDTLRSASDPADDPVAPAVATTCTGRPAQTWHLTPVATGAALWAR